MEILMFWEWSPWLLLSLAAVFLIVLIVTVAAAAEESPVAWTIVGVSFILTVSLFVLGLMGASHQDAHDTTDIHQTAIAAIKKNQGKEMATRAQDILWGNSIRTNSITEVGDCVLVIPENPERATITCDK